jgi:hypothetical protein
METQPINATGTSDTEHAAHQPGKQPYTAPRLIVHGGIDKITQQLGLGPDDGFLGSLS